MMSRNQPRQTKREKERNETLRRLYCILCTLAGDFRMRPLEIHHIVRGNKRLGHWFTLQLCAGHHQGQWTDQPIRVGIKSGRHAFKEQYGYDELELWQRQQVALGLNDELPKSKRVPRRLHVDAEMPSDLVELPTSEAPLPKILPRRAVAGNRDREEAK